MNLTSFSIPSFRKSTIEARLTKLAKKAAKYGNDDITFSFGEKTMNVVKTVDGELSIEFIEVMISGDAPQIAGWNFLARIEIFEGDENLVHNVPGNEIELNDEFRTHNGHCDHCNTDRRRNDVYVLTDGTKQIAVGRTCLRDFLGIDDPKEIVNRAQFFEELKNIQDEDYLESAGSYGYLELKEVLLRSAALIRTKGYVSKAKQAETGYETTGDAVKLSMSGVVGYEIETNDDDRMWVEKTIGFFRSVESFGNDYKDNIRVIMKQDIIKKEHVALIASSVITAQRELAPKSIVAESNFVGDVKARLRGLDVMIDKIIYLGEGVYGSSYLHLMKDQAGNVFSWITGNKIQEAEGTQIKIDATVKDHKLYNGTKQTVLTRAKLV